MGEIRNLMWDIHSILNLMKDFVVGIGDISEEEGRMLIVHKGKRYAVKIVEYENPSDNDIENVRKLKYQI